MPYQWQFRQPGSKEWTSCNLDENVVLEKLFCDVENVEVEVVFRDGRLPFLR